MLSQMARFHFLMAKWYSIVSFIWETSTLVLEIWLCYVLMWVYTDLASQLLEHVGFVLLLKREVFVTASWPHSLHSPFRAQTTPLLAFLSQSHRHLRLCSFSAPLIFSLFSASVIPILSLSSLNCILCLIHSAVGPTHQMFLFSLLNVSVLIFHFVFAETFYFPT